MRITRIKRTILLSRFAMFQRIANHVADGLALPVVCTVCWRQIHGRPFLGGTARDAWLTMPVAQARQVARRHYMRHARRLVIHRNRRCAEMALTRLFGKYALKLKRKASSKVRA